MNRREIFKLLGLSAAVAGLPKDQVAAAVAAPPPAVPVQSATQEAIAARMFQNFPGGLSIKIDPKEQTYECEILGTVRLAPIDPMKSQFNRLKPISR